MTPAARAQLERVVTAQRAAGPTACEEALGIAARRRVFGPARLDLTSLLSRASGASDARSATFVVGNGVRLELAAGAPEDWLISGFTGGAFGGR
jgi:hypothetical protein